MQQNTTLQWQQPIQQQAQPLQQAKTTQPEAKRKRVQVPAACMQCKKAHAACSNTRPCDRCVRINQASACVDSPLPRNVSMPTNGTFDPQSIPSYIESPVIPQFHPTPTASFNENDLSRYLFDEQEFPMSDFPNTNFESMESTPESPSSSSSSCIFVGTPVTSTTPSPPATPSCTSACASTPSPSSPACSSVPCSSTPASSSTSTPASAPASPSVPASAPSTTFVSVAPPNVGSIFDAMTQPPGPTQYAPVHDPVLPPAVTAPSSSSVAAALSNAHPPTVHGMPHLPSQFTSSGFHQIQVPPAKSPMELLMAELVQQNKRMENMVSSMSSEMKALRQEVNQLKQAPALMPKLNKTSSAPATAVWSVNEGVLLEYNEKFCALVELKEIPAGYMMQHFFGGPCSKAASSRMHSHLSGVQNGQPATDYAVVERKKPNGEVTRLMIVVNVVPTPTPVFITVMYEV